MDVFGNTRSRIAPDHALITPDTHVTSPLVGWKKSSAIIHISPEMGARFTQYTAQMEAGGSSLSAGPGIQRFAFLQSGKVAVGSQKLSGGGYLWLPADGEHVIQCIEPASLIVFEKPYLQLDGASAPEPVFGDAAKVPGAAFMGDEDARLQTLLPISPEFDMAVNIFTYQPGATLPQVEIHVMEHGLQMLSGMGVYRLSDNYYPVAAGDVIWMASYCPQWFVAMGKQPASYIYYKDIHRDRLSDKAKGASS